MMSETCSRDCKKAVGRCCETAWKCIRRNEVSSDEGKGEVGAKNGPIPTRANAVGRPPSSVPQTNADASNASLGSNTPSWEVAGCDLVYNASQSNSYDSTTSSAADAALAETESSTTSALATAR